MEEALKKLRLKHTLTTTLIAGAFLLLLLAGFFSILFGSSEIVVTKALERSLSRPSSELPGEIDPESRRCMMFWVQDGRLIYVGEELSIYGDSSDDVLSAAIDRGNGKFKVSDMYFRVMSETRENNITAYAVYDRTSDHNLLVNTSFVIALLYVASILMIGLLAYFLSARALKPVEDSIKRQRDLVANASHELKTPLTIISTDLSVLQSEPASSVESNEKWLTSIEKQVARMNVLIQNMLELSKLEQTVIPKENLDFSETVEGACLAFEAVCFEKGATLITEIQPDVSFFGEKNALERLVIILLDNAIKYCGENGKIGCMMECDGKHVKLSIMNTGQAISDEDSTRVFDRFYRSDGARENPGNNSFGLGLAIAQATVFAHNGTISCHGLKGRGTVFEVILPMPKKAAIKSGERRTPKFELKQKYNEGNVTDFAEIDVMLQQFTVDSAGTEDAAGLPDMRGDAAKTETTGADGIRDVQSDATENFGVDSVKPETEIDKDVEPEKADNDGAGIADDTNNPT